MLFVVVLEFVDMGAAVVWEGVVDPDADVIGFIGGNVTEVTAVFGVDDFDGVGVVLVLRLCDEEGVEVHACKVADATAKVDACYLGVIEVWVDIGPVEAIIVREWTGVGAVDDGDVGVKVVGFICLPDGFTLRVGERLALWLLRL